MINLGPSTPFVEIATFGLVIDCSVAVLLLRQRRSTWKQSTTRHKSVIILLLAAVTFVLWGSSTGHGGPHADGGMVGYTHGGMLHYVSAISYQPRAGGPWSHDFSVRPLALLGTIGLNAVAVIVALVGCRWTGGVVPNNAVNRSGEVRRI